VETSNVVLSAPLQQLMDEHVALRKDMDHFYEITEEHFAKEEKVLFPLAEKLLSVNEKQELEHLFQVL
jgi:hemerythrin-like domain-containing protein